MGKTGTTTIQAALHESKDVLQAAGIRYLGQWLGYIDSNFDGFEGFQRFLKQGPEELGVTGARLCKYITGVANTTGNTRFLISNEQYLENIRHLTNFFLALRQKVSLEVIIYVRAPAKWLPSAVAQWGIIHKTYPGPVRPFGVTARTLMGQYYYIRQWREILGSAVSVRKYHEGADVAEHFLQALSIGVPANVPREQQRPSLADAVMRAAFNTKIAAMALPEEFNRTVPAPDPSFPVGLSEKLKHLFNYAELPAILQENRDILQYIKDEFGIELEDDHQQLAEPVAGDTLVDALVGRLVDIVSQQALQLRSLKERFDTFESQRTN